MYLSLVFLPLLGSFCSGFLGRYLGPIGAGRITLICVSSSLFLSLTTFYEVGLLGNPCYIYFLTWFNCEFLAANWSFQFDGLTAVMLVVVTFISTLVHLYSTEYMAHDPHLPRFMSYLSLFTFFMLILVTGDNFLQLFVGWEGVGLCSFLLINFWFTRIQANKAAIQAMIVNRIGDFGLALGIFALYRTFGSVEYSTVFALAPYFQYDTIYFFGYEFNLLTFIGVFLFIGAVGKSAQLGLHTWLPSAMEGPTPVSALIHAATMVTAGVFLLARCSPLFEFAPNALFIVTLVGAMTAFFAASTGLLQNDLKRVIAYSTCSQLGYMVFACGLSNYSVGIFHLSNHAFFKALLFLGAGSVIHAVADEQDMRRMGGLRRLIPFTFSVMFLGSFALMGFPFLTGFYSKDVILETAYACSTRASTFAYVLGTCAAFLTAFYSMRLSYLTFLSLPNGSRSVIYGAHESPLAMMLPLFLLSFPSVFIGYLSRDLFIGLGTDYWLNSIFVLPENYFLVDAEFISIINKLLPVFLSLCGSLLALVLYSTASHFLFNLKISRAGVYLYTFLNRKWFFDKVYNEVVNQELLRFGYHTSYKTIDRGIIEVFGPMGLSFFITKVSRYFSRIQSGIVFDYLLYMLVSLMVIIMIMDFSFSFFHIFDSCLILIFFFVLLFEPLIL